MLIALLGFASSLLHILLQCGCRITNTTECSTINLSLNLMKGLASQLVLWLILLKIHSQPKFMWSGMRIGATESQPLSSPRRLHAKTHSIWLKKELIVVTLIYELRSSMVSQWEACIPYRS